MLPPELAELPLMVLLLNRSDPPGAMPEPLAMPPPPTDAELPLIVLLLMIRDELSLKIPPPNVTAELLLIVLLFKMASPLKVL